MNDIIIVALITGTCSVLSVIIPFLFSRKSENKEKINQIHSQINELTEWRTGIGDILYQMIDHMSTNNNTGNMKNCLDRYNEFNRHKS